jgi:hypothetical protein
VARADQRRRRGSEESRKTSSAWASRAWRLAFGVWRLAFGVFGVSADGEAGVHAELGFQANCGQVSGKMGGVGGRCAKSKFLGKPGR